MTGAQSEVQTQNQSTGALSVSTQVGVSAELSQLKHTVEWLKSMALELRVERSQTNNELQHSRTQAVKVEAHTEDLKSTKTITRDRELIALKT